MIPRGVLDIPAGVLWRAAIRTLYDRRQAEFNIEAVLAPRDKTPLVSLSVRSALDAVFTATNWRAGDEVIFSAVTIGEMAQIAEAHGLSVVTVDVDAATLAPDWGQIQQRITPRTRALVVAHLFGSRIDLTQIAALAHRNGILLIEDAAQAYSADSRRGDELADISLFSFGIIKSQTALGGAVSYFRDPVLARRCQRVQEAWPLQDPRSYAKRLWRACVLQLLSVRPFFSVAAALARWMGMNLDNIISSAARGFRSTDWMGQIRKRPCVGLVKLLLARLSRPDRTWIEKRTSIAEALLSRLPDRVLIGRSAVFSTRWVLPIQSDNPDTLVARLRDAGFDATRTASHLRVIAPSAVDSRYTTPHADAWLQRMLFLPLHPAMNNRHLDQLGAIIGSHASAAAAKEANISFSSLHPESPNCQGQESRSQAALTVSSAT